MAQHVAVGLDAGGSETLLLAHGSEESDLLERRGPAANPKQVGTKEAVDVLAALVRDAIPSGVSVARLSVCGGVAGAGRSEEREALARRLEQSLAVGADTVHVQIVSDACIALETAFGPGSGVVIIAGTGSIVFGRTQDGTARRAGGWGRAIGDAGSGRAVGRAGLRAVAEAFDGGTDTALRSDLSDRYGIDDRSGFLRWIYRSDVGLQEVAPLVVDAAAADDPAASEILAAQTAALAEQVEWLLVENDDIAHRIALHGGMFQNDGYTRRLRRALRDQVPDWTIERLRRPPAEGALRRARRLPT